MKWHLSGARACEARQILIALPDAPAARRAALLAAWRREARPSCGKEHK